LDAKLCDGLRIVARDGVASLRAVRAPLQRLGLSRQLDALAHRLVDLADVALVAALRMVAHEDRLAHRDHVADRPGFRVGGVGSGAELPGAAPLTLNAG